MPDVEAVAREQEAVLWPCVGQDGYGGSVVSSVVALQPQCGTGVRWKWQQSEMMAPDNATVTVDATVVVDRVVAIDSLMWLGRLQDLASTAGPGLQTPSGLHVVKAFTNTPSLKNRATRFKVGLVRYRGKLPQGFG